MSTIGRMHGLDKYLYCAKLIMKYLTARMEQGVENGRNANTPPMKPFT